MKIKKKTLVSLILLVVLIMFSFPWVMVSCGGEPVTKATGFQIAFGKFNVTDNLGVETGASTPGANIWLILSLILLVGGILIGFLVKREDASSLLAWVSTAVSVIFILFLIIAPSAFYRRFGGSSNSSEDIFGGMGQIINLSFRPAFYISLILVIIAAILSFNDIRKPETEKEPQIGKSGQENSAHTTKSELVIAEIFDRIQKGTSKIMNNVKTKTEVLSESAKIKNQIKTTESEKSYLIQELGTMTHASLQDNILSEERINELREKSNEIKEKEEQINKLKQMLSELELKETMKKAVGKCPNCGAPIYEGDKFCGTCGLKLPEPDKKEEVKDQTNVSKELVCPKCGHVNSPGSKFCIECGTPLTDEKNKDLKQE